jgi:hypothetical protein
LGDVFALLFLDYLILTHELRCAPQRFFQRETNNLACDAVRLLFILVIRLAEGEFSLRTSGPKDTADFLL